MRSLARNIAFGSPKSRRADSILFFGITLEVIRFNGANVIRFFKSPYLNKSLPKNIVSIFYLKD